jgi:hypothetical protein
VGPERPAALRQEAAQALRAGVAPTVRAKIVPLPVGRLREGQPRAAPIPVALPELVNRRGAQRQAVLGRALARAVARAPGNERIVLFNPSSPEPNWRLYVPRERSCPMAPATRPSLIKIEESSPPASGRTYARGTAFPFQHRIIVG